MRRFVVNVARRARHLAMPVRRVPMAIALWGMVSAAQGRDPVLAGAAKVACVLHIRATGRGVQVQGLAQGNICRFARVVVVTGRHSQIAVKQNVRVIALPAVVSAGNAATAIF